MQMQTRSTILATEIAALAYHAARTIWTLPSAFAEWRTATATAEALHKFSNRELNDLGLVRGDIEPMSLTLASRKAR